MGRESILPISTTFQATVLAYGTQLSHERTRQSQEEMSENNLQLQDQLTLNLFRGSILWVMSFTN